MKCAFLISLRKLTCSIRTAIQMGKPKKTPEELAEDNKRTDPMGLFNTAEAYWRAAQALEKAKVKGGHADSPVRLLYYHAIELYLKALLRQYYDVDKLSNKFRHNIKRLANRAEKLGLVIVDEDRGLLDLMGDTDIVIRARYSRTGYMVVPAFDDLNRICENLRKSVATILRDAKIMVRL